MILNRLGNKTRIADDIVCHFPKHRVYVEMFFGAGGVFFNKPVANYNFCNDIDDDVVNLWTVMQTKKDDLIAGIEVLPISETLFKYWKTNKETDPIYKALRFLLLSNFGYMGKPDTLHFSKSAGDQRKNLLSKIDSTLKKLSHCRFMCCDFRDVLKKIQYRNDESDYFIYADPPYLNVANNYSCGFSYKDAADLFELLVNSRIKFALSEFDNEFILALAKKHKLNIITIGERNNMKNRRTEILITNYTKSLLLFDEI